MKITKTYLYSAWLVFLTIFAFAAQVRAEDAPAAAKAPQPSAKKTVAVADFSAKSINVVIDKDIKDFTFSAEYIDLLNSEMMTALVNDPTFEVIDRARLRDLAKNGNLADVTPSSMVELGKAAGADYVVSGDIELIELDQRTQNFPGYTQTQLVGHMVVNLRVVEIATSHVVYAHKVDDVCTAALNQYSTITVPAFMEQLKSDTVRRLVSSISENISPIEVCAVHSGKVYLDRGEQAFRGGEILEIVAEADKVYDKNGNILDIVEDHAGKVRVDTVRQKVSIATIIEESRPIQVGWIARRIEE
jgi:curli biogenesis system outer membrane secretion channel CsgG